MLPDEDQRWELARRLLHDSTIDTVDRVVGLLVLFYAQPLSRICQLTISHVHSTTRATTSAGTGTGTGTDDTSTVDTDESGSIESGMAVQLSLGATPLELPGPLGDLVLDLVANRRGHAVIGHTDDHPWLFPGGAPGRHIGDARLAFRLKRLGIWPRISRNSALMQLAAVLPAKVLSDLLGISLRSAVNWNEEAGNSRPAYAAHIARRPTPP